MCLTDNWSDKDCITPLKGKIYTIRGIRKFELGYGFIFEEIINPAKNYSDGFHELYFWYNNFRPVTYNMDINYEILKDFKPVQEKADTPIRKSIEVKK